MKKLYAFRLLLPVLFLLQPIFLLSQSNKYLHFDRVDDFVKLDGASQYIVNAGAISITGLFYCY